MYKIFLSKHFKREMKGLMRKYPNLSTEILAELSAFNKGHATSLGANIYKIRMGSKSVGLGKSSAFRLIALLIEIDLIIAPLTLYAKSDRATIPRREIMYHMAMVKYEL